MTHSQPSLPFLARVLKTSALALGFSLSLGALSPAQAKDTWKQYGKLCDDTVFKDPTRYEVPQLSTCSKTWIAYRTDYKSVKGDYKTRVVTAMKLLYVKGDDTDAIRAQDILTRLEVTDLPERLAQKPTQPAKPERKPFSPPEPSKADIKRAEAHLKTGLAAYKKKDYKKAQASYEKMVDVAPGYPKSHYNAACIYALTNNEAKMANSLQNLRDLANAGNKDADKLLKMTKTDSDFDGVRETSTEYRRITGFTRVRVINHLGEMGEENTDNLVDSFKKLGYDASQKESDKKVVKNPVVFYAEHAKAQAYIVTQLIEHPKIVTTQMEAKSLCSDGQCYDVVVQWNDEVSGKNPKNASPHLRMQKRS